MRGFSAVGSGPPTPGYTGENVSGTPSSLDELRAMLLRAMRSEPEAVDRLLAGFRASWWIPFVRRRGADHAGREARGRARRAPRDPGSHARCARIRPAGSGRADVKDATGVRRDARPRVRMRCDPRAVEGGARTGGVRGPALEGGREERDRASYTVLLHAALDRLDEPLEEEAPGQSLLEALAPGPCHETAKAAEGVRVKPRA